MDELNKSTNILRSHSPSKIITWQVILIVLLTSFFIISVHYKYYKYDNYITVVQKENENHIGALLLTEKDLLKLTSKKLKIANKYIKYEIKEIVEVYQTNENLEKYYETIIELKLPNNKENYFPVLLQFESKKTTLMKEIFKSLKKGMM